MNNYEFWEKYNKFIKGEIGRLCRTKKELYIDLHIHSNYSADGKQNLKQILETTKEKGFDIIAITDHDSLNVYDELYDIVSKVLSYLFNSRINLFLMLSGICLLFSSCLALDK